ncbi:rRNA maturation RNase YbeY [Flagellimonas aquimarina]|uniref:Endoribonuclease YbeY n=1 Tax=Flagellimonas aquimarina TaxID=2201895 RepID=A0A316L4L5_9FLAO|nr:rRNA maturation RNase YbeY [Allomuricauda koreensis]PWL39869.1 rRNA maturation RNase YbeY [Allomuricauda koreensis]
MIDFHFKSEFVLEDKTHYSDWVARIIESEGFVVGQLDYVFCADDELLGINQKYLNHDTYTDIITFDYSSGKTLSGDIFISTERVAENALVYKVSLETELLRVMCHGVLHLMGFSDKTDDEKVLMRGKEEEKIKLFHVEH